MALLHVDFFSDVLGMCMQMDVILPQRTNGQIGMEGKRSEGKYPTLYLLHGMSDDHTIWQRRTSIERYVADLGIAVVMPSTHLAWYCNTAYSHRYWTYISEELPRICRDFFPAMSDKREETFAAGLSMGGYGALKLGLRASETFGKVASLSGALDAADFASWGGRDEAYWSGVLGPVESRKNSDDDLFYQAELLKKSGKPLPEIYMWCGTEDGLLGHNHRMRDHLNALGYNLTYAESTGNHGWGWWDEQIQPVLKWMF